MKLSAEQTKRVQEQTGASVVPEDNPSMGTLKENFGDHTFFLDHEGLHVWESVEEEPSESAKLVGVRIASWSSDEKKSLVPHEPAPSRVLEEPGSDS